MSYRTVLLVSGPASFSTRDVWEGYRAGLQEAGVHVIPYPTFAMLRTLSPDLIANDIIGRALDVRNAIDAVIFIDGLSFQGERLWVPETLRRAGKTTVLIATDDPYNPINGSDSVYTFRFTNEIHAASDGVRYLPTATLPPPDSPAVPRDPGAPDLVFIGTVFEDRFPLLRKLAFFCEEQRLRFFLAGNFPVDVEEIESLEHVTVEKRNIRAAEKWQLYRQAKVVLNLFRESESPAASPSPRVFEVTASGTAALLTGPGRTEVTRLYGDSVYTFDDFDQLRDQLLSAVGDSAERLARVERARDVTLAGQLYRHRAEQLLTTLRDSELADTQRVRDDRLAWIVGCGRSGSTWLNEMLGDLPGIRSWHEPYFGRFFRHVYQDPDEYQRPASFFFHRYRHTWTRAIRRMFFDVVADRFPEYGEQALVVKEVNTPELFSRIRHVFPSSAMIFLVRDPYDVLDSYIDLQKPGSWNKKYGSRSDDVEQSVRQTAEHIHESIAAAASSYEKYPESRRLMIRYEDLLADAPSRLQDCAALLSIDVSDDEAARVAGKHDFSTYKQTGPTEFRRYGRAGSWLRSGNFTPAVTAIADEVLGNLRERLGYAAAQDSLTDQ